jgi:hypothetical protein
MGLEIQTLARVAHDRGRNQVVTTPALIANLGLKNWNGSTKHEKNMTTSHTQR